MSERVILRLDKDGEPMNYCSSVIAETDDKVIAKAEAVVASNIWVSRRGKDSQLWLSEENYKIVKPEEAFSIMARVELELVNVD